MEKNTVVLSIAFAILMGTLSIGYNSISLQITSAQMIMDSNMTNKNMSGMTGSEMMSGMKGENVTGSINLMSIFTKAIGADFKVSLSEAATNRRDRYRKWISRCCCSNWARERILSIHYKGYRL